MTDYVSMEHLDERTYQKIDKPNMPYPVWLPAIPLPYVRGVFRKVYICGYMNGCGRKFKSQTEYELHYRTEQLAEHITKYGGKAA